jgi:hypothetical protein
MSTPIRLAAVAAAAFMACATSGAQGPTNQAPPPQSPVATRHPYEMDGRVQSVGGGLLGMGRSITVGRDQAPPAVIHVANETRVTVDGRVSGLGDVRPGDDVRVLFDFDKDTPVAIQIEAKPHR